MEIWAAIDLLQGCVVTLQKGKRELCTTWSRDPLRAAKRWENEDATGLHIVDLDEALGSGSNRSVAESIVRSANIPVQVAGGIRKIAQVERWLSLGAEHVVLGTVAYDDPGTLREIVNRYGAERVVVALDYESDRVVTRGWTSRTTHTAQDALKALQTMQIRRILVTSVEVVGTGGGPDISTLKNIRSQFGMYILAAGGINTIKDLQALQGIGVDGAVVGQALYEGTIRLEDLKSGKILC